MFEFDGVALRQTPISLLALACGDFVFDHEGHDIQRRAEYYCDECHVTTVVTVEPVRSYSVG
jgi:hypothetical protein